MWARTRQTNATENDNHRNEEPILLFQPSYNAKKSFSPKTNFIGGNPLFYPDSDNANASAVPKTCQVCGDDLFLLIQMYTPMEKMDRTLYVFGCNRNSCSSGWGRSGGAANGETTERSFRCFRSQRSNVVEKEEKQEHDHWANPISLCDANADDDDDVSDDGWGDDGGTDKFSRGSKMKDIESMLEECEIKHEDQKKKEFSFADTSKGSPAIKTAKTAAVRGDAVVSSHEPKSVPNEQFCCQELDLFNEPNNNKASSSENNKNGHDRCDSEDEDMDVCAKDEKKVQGILSKYLDEEEDESILSIFRKKEQQSKKQGGAAVTSDKQGGEERYEKLPPDERAWMKFSNRIKRAPAQVARYAYGGEALWSLPIPSKQTSTKQTKKKGNKHSKKSSPSSLPNIPNCPGCGSKREFEFQLMPSLLHSLSVDKHTTTSTPSMEGQKSNTDWSVGGGMNWGVVAVYSCPISCEGSCEEFVVVQASVEESCNPSSRRKIVKEEDEDII